MYVDTSVVAAMYLPELSSDYVQATLSASKGHSAAEILVPEFRSVLVRKEREGKLQQKDASRVWNLFQEHVRAGAWNLLPVTRELMESAADVIHLCSRHVSVRTLDAIHLAACRDYREHPLFTGDDVMKKGAKILHIPMIPDH